MRRPHYFCDSRTLLPSSFVSCCRVRAAAWMSACEDRQSYDGPRRKIGSSLRMIFQTGIVSGVFWSDRRPSTPTGCLPFQSRCERIGFDCPWPEMGLPCAKKIGMDKTPRARLDQAQSGDARRQSIAGDSAVGRNRSSFTFASQKCFPNHAQARTDAGLRPL